MREIATRLSRSRGAISEAVLGLQELGVAREVGVARPRRAGRPARSFDFCTDGALVVGVEIGSARSRVVVVDARGVVRVEQDVARSGDVQGEDMIDHAELSRLLALAGVRMSRIRAIGIAVAFAADGRPRPDDLRKRDERLLEEQYGCPVLIDDTIRLAAIAEHNCGASSLFDDILQISVCDEVTPTLILEGKVRLPRHARSHEGYTPVLSWRRNDRVDDVARGLSTVVRAVDPGIVVITGAGEHTRALIAAMSRQFAVGMDAPLVAAVLGDMASTYGAAVSAFQRFSSAVNSYPALPAPRLVHARSHR
ncbi:MAG: hypothetical protein AAGC61_01635 [Microbacterium sp.]